jgi:LytS/YehU family sensor histidine kinase
MRTQFFWEVQGDLIVYGALAAFWTLLQAWDERQRLALRAEQIRTRMVSMRLDALSAQIDPHFLFNALNAVSAVMYEDLPRTEKLLVDLGQLLRHTLDTSGPTWSLADERAHTERYVALLKARFTDRIRVRWHVETRLDRASVPRFAIQTLVENAVKHNHTRIEPLTVDIEVSERAGEAVLEVRDDGRGFREHDAAQPGRALARLAEMLRLIHGSRASLERSNGAGGGARVQLRFPWNGEQHEPHTLQGPDHRR